MKKTALFLLFLVVLSSVVGCETFKGFAKDVENTGSNIGEALNRN